MKTRNSRAGFTLIEVLIALVILSVGLASLIPLLIHTIRGNAFGRTVTQAATFSQDQMEELRRAPFADLESLCAGGLQTAALAGTPLSRRVWVRDADGTGGCDSDLLVIEVCTAETDVVADRCFHGTTGVDSYHFFSVRARH